MIDFTSEFTKIFQLKGLKPKNKGCTNFYECCDLTKKVYLILPLLQFPEIRLVLKDIGNKSSDCSLDYEWCRVCTIA